MCSLDEVRLAMVGVPLMAWSCKTPHTDNEYPMPRHAQGEDEVFVGRLRKDLTHCPGHPFLGGRRQGPLKGAATNTVQIAETWSLG